MFQKKYWERDQLHKRRRFDHPVVKEHVLSKIELLKEYININNDTSLLDVGCGNGFFSVYFDQICNVTAIDYSQKMLDLNPVKNKLQMDANHLEFDDNCFDIVFCQALLHHVEDIDNVIKEMRRVSKKHVVILEPNRNNPLMFLFSLLSKEERKALQFSNKYLRDKVKRNKLRIIDSFAYGMIVPNKVPTILLPVCRLFNFKQPIGITNIIIAEKNL